MINSFLQFFIRFIYWKFCYFNLYFQEWTSALSSPGWSARGNRNTTYGATPSTSPVEWSRRVSRTAFKWVFSGLKNIWYFITDITKFFDKIFILATDQIVAHISMIRPFSTQPFRPSAARSAEDADDSADFLPEPDENSRSTVRHRVRPPIWRPEILGILLNVFFYLL